MIERTIWKAQLELNGTQVIGVPVGAELLCAREQHDSVCIWFRCDPNEKSKETRTIALIGTGNAAPVGGRYLGTASLRGGTLMVHAFEITI